MVGLEEALEMAEDCLGVALGMYVRADEDLPVPGCARDGQVLVLCPSSSRAKLTIYTAMREQGVYQRYPGRQIGHKCGSSAEARRSAISISHQPGRECAASCWTRP